MVAENHFGKQWERDVIASANTFRVIRFLGSGRWARREYGNDRAAAEADAKGDPRAMLYAINAAGRHAIIDRAEYASS